MARPTDYCAEIVAQILESLADGDSLRTICAKDGMPARSTVFKWLSIHQEFADQYTRAREAQADAIFDDILEIADDSDGDLTEDKDGKEVVNHENIQRARLRVDARKWMAGKLRPKVYGDKTMITGAGENGAVVVEIARFADSPPP